MMHLLLTPNFVLHNHKYSFGMFPKTCYRGEGSEGEGYVRVVALQNGTWSEPKFGTLISALTFVLNGLILGGANKLTKLKLTINKNMGTTNFLKEAANFNQILRKFAFCAFQHRLASCL